MDQFDIGPCFGNKCWVSLVVGLKQEVIYGECGQFVSSEKVACGVKTFVERKLHSMKKTTNNWISKRGKGKTAELLVVAEWLLW